MKLSMQWLRDWVDCPWDGAELGRRLTMAGFELEALDRAAPAFSQVVVARIDTCEPHPQADKLRVCRVSTGSGPPLQIVCGAANARAGLVTALALPGAVLPGGTEIRAATLRGVSSQGMLCSARELGLDEAAEGIVELPADLPLGQDLRTALALDDEILDIAITPNRGDAMSVLGLAREVAALADRPLRPAPQWPIPAVDDALRLPIELIPGAGCRRFLGRLIRGLRNDGQSPWWLRERLRRAGLRSISPVVDVTNYVLLDLGQPMHAYDAARLVRGITVRRARAGESLTLLDGKAYTLDPEVLVIADGAGPVGLAGIMGGERTAVTRATADVFLEVAWFEPAVIAGRARRLGLATEASQRFERGVDPTLQERAMTMATALLQQVAGGTAGPIVAADTGQAPLEPLAVPLRRSQLQRLLGRAVADSVVERTLRGLGLRITANADGWTASAPAHRFDLAIEADLIEEIARIGGYEQLPADAPRVAQRIMPVPESQPAERSILELLAARGYQEAVHYGFVDPKLQALLFPDVEPVRLVNPIAEDLGVMRLSLWPNLIRAARDNLRRQQNRVKLCELGATFASDGTETERIAAIWTGLRHDEQWGSARSELRALADFHDLRGDLAALCSLCGDASVFELHPASLGCLHPGRSAAIYRDGRLVGYIGELHPELVLKLDLTYSPQLFELERSSLRALHVQPRNLSPFPSIRRDLAVVVDEPVTFSALRERVTLIAGEALSELRCFDVYRGAGVETGRKSIALGLIFQDNSRTLTDEDADRLMAAIRSDLGASLNARIRE